jgi:hypothetical protein
VLSQDGKSVAGAFPFTSPTAEVEAGTEVDVDGVFWPVILPTFRGMKANDIRRCTRRKEQASK